MRIAMPSLFGFVAMSLTSVPVASYGLAFGFGGAAALSAAGGMIQTSAGTGGSATFFSAVAPGCSGSSSARRLRYADFRHARVGARITRRLQPLRLIGLQAGGRAWHPGARGRVVAAEIFVEIGNAAIRAHHLLDARLRFGAIKTLRGGNDWRRRNTRPRGRVEPTSA